MSFTISGIPVTVEMALDNDPFDTSISSWTDISDYIYKISISRGRQHDLAEFRSGTCSITLDNQDERFNPLNTSSPYYNSATGKSKIQPMKRVRIKAVYDSTTYYLYDGFVTNIPQTFLLQGAGALAGLDLVDAFKLMNLNTLNDRAWSIGVERSSNIGSSTYIGYEDEQELSSARVTRILNAFTWDSSRRSIRTGDLQVVQQAGTSNVLTALKDVASSEQGAFFMGQGSDGFDAIFKDRNYIRTQQFASNATFGNGAGELPYIDVALAFDDSRLVNVSSVTRSGSSTAQTWRDTDSITEYGSRSESLSTLNVSDADALSVAKQRVSSFSEPSLRVTQLSVNPQIDTDLWTQALGRDLLDHITVKVPLPDSTTLTQELLIEGIEHEIDSQNNLWNWKIRTSPAAEVGAWILGSSLLGQGTNLSW